MSNPHEEERNVCVAFNYISLSFFYPQCSSMKLYSFLFNIAMVFITNMCNNYYFELRAYCFRKCQSTLEKSTLKNKNFRLKENHEEH